MKKLIPILLCVIVSGCGHTAPVVELYNKPTLDVKLPEPLQLAPVTWKVLVVDKVPYFALDTQQFSNLANDMETIQGRTSLYYQIIGGQKQYYETPVPPAK